MITREDVVRTIREYIDEEELKDILEDGIDAGDAQDVLEQLGVPDAADRIKMYNRYPFDLDDIIALANVPFSVVTCDMCGEEYYVVQPDDWGKFQGIYTRGEIGPVMINGNEKEICEYCYGNPIFH